MLYKKPDDLKYTDMSIWIDKLAKKETQTEEELGLAFQYMYHIAFMLAHKHKYFNASYYYEDFAHYFATIVLQRMFLNPKLKEVDENGEPVLPPVRSVLNYMKSTAYGLKVNFEQQNYCQKFISTGDGSFVSGYAFNDKIRESAVSYLECDMDLYFKTISKVVKHEVYKNSHYRKDREMMKNIYISCLLSMLNSITFSQADMDSIKNTYSLPDAKFKYITRLYSKNKEECVILYHLPQSMYSYIKVLVREVFGAIEEDIKEMSSSTMPISDSVLSEIVYLELDGKVNFD